MGKYITDHRIPREEIFTLLHGMGSDISTHSLSMWIKSKTEKEWVVVPREFCLLAVSFLEKEMVMSATENRTSKKVYFDKGNYLKELENYL